MIHGDRPEVRELTEFLDPYSRRYIIKDRKKWITVDEPLTQEIVFDHVNGEIIAGGFGKYKVDYVCLDLDLHDEYFTKDIKNSVRYSRYKLIADTLRPPSLVSQSSENGGLHLWYKFNTPVYYGIIKHLILKRLNITADDLKNKYQIDILPTPRQAVAFPHAVKRGGYILDPETLKIIPHPASLSGSTWLNDVMRKCKTYTFTELFQDTPEVRIINHYKSKQAIAIFRGLNKINSTLFSIPKQGETNGFIGDVVYKFFISGIKEAGIIQDKISELFNLNNIRLKEDTSGRGLYVRICSHLRRLEKNKKTGIFIENYKRKEPGLFDLIQSKAITEWLISTFNLKTKLRPSMTKFLTELIQWERYIRELGEDDRFILDIQYKYFYHRTKNNKLIPLPRVLMRKWNDRYNNLIPLLVEAGILTKRIKYYNPATAKLHLPEIQGTCNYYAVAIPEIN